MINSANIFREKRKTIKFVIENNGQLCIYAPYKLSYDIIEKIVKEKESLLQKKIIFVKKRNEKYGKLFNFESIFILGKEYKVFFTNKSQKILLSESYLLIPQKYNNNGKVGYFIKKSIKELAEKIISDRIFYITKNLGLKEKNSFSKLSFGNFKSKWGSCDSQKIIKFNWRLVMLKQSVIDFVICHELAHIKEMNHSKKFYEILEYYCPNWKEERKILKEMSFLLSLYN